MTVASDPTDQDVRWDVIDDGVATITLAAPPANALGQRLVDGLTVAVDGLVRADVHVVVITSGVEGFFAAGADIKYMVNASVALFSAYGDALRRVLMRLAAPDFVSIAAIEGLALGGGLELAMACTLRVAGRDALLGLPEVKLGLIPGAGGTQRLPRLVGRGRALDMMLTGRQVGAEEAVAIGLVDRVVDAGTVADASLVLARELRSHSRPAQQAVLRTVDEAYSSTLSVGLAYEAAQVRDVFENGEAHEGMAAFLERRQPHFS
jgi:enoyl-CoA hydratase